MILLFLLKLNFKRANNSFWTKIFFLIKNSRLFLSREFFIKKNLLMAGYN